MTIELDAVNAEAAAAAPPAAEAWPPASQAWYAVFVLSLSLMINFLDRGIMNLLVPPIKRDLQLSDMQISLLMGFAFVFFYILLGLPVARLVDSRSRKLILASGITIWSVMTGFCGLARSFGLLFVGRVGVGVGEACSGPATYSLLADYFPPEKLPRAISALQLGFVAGTGLASIIGAAIIHLLSASPTYEVPVLGTTYAWQLVFFAVGLPGLIVALLMLTIREPRRRGRLQAGVKTLPLKTVVAYLGTNWRVYGPMFLGLALSSIPASGVLAWGATLFQRNYGWSPAEYGTITGFSLLITMPAGLFAGSALAELLARRGYDDANMRVLVLATALGLPGAIAMPLMPSPWVALVLMFLNGVIVSMGAPTQNAAIQVVTPNQMRGQVTALYLFVLNILGFGFGPTFIALFTQYLFHDDAMLRYAMALATAILSPLALIVMWAGMKPYGRAVARARSWG